ncbi:FG-GAP-like repeat-containing protein [Streptomyces rhizosphaerihabitans]|uniref:FG-GAP-like repeat-containing protein n=1 Tax=Streptomyces rhizosphaerihabitans TaxID=1266770 RepID=UPI0021BF989E|nr:FG-GAP-like repeat-containing protein [Streptomyces rhizosphaerihabitans]MCT9008179.1 FG-GAP-like repeat-containing protein [Streptomyces rhizosphaerihabitans]
MSRSPHKRSRRPVVLGAVAVAAALAGGLLIALPGGASAAASGLADDFNGDGYRDLATGAPGAVAGGKAKAGAVVVNYGSSSGISAARHKTTSQSSSGVPGDSETSDRFGTELAHGDLNRDGYGDLVVGTPLEDVSGDVDGGLVTILWGSSSGLSGGTTISDPNASGHDRFGQSLAVGDFTGDGKADLAVGSTGKDVWIFKGGFTKSGGAAGKVRLDTQIESGAYPKGAVQLAAGDFGNDGTDDLVVGSSAGNFVYRGASTGPTLQTEAGAGYASAFAVADFDRDGHDDLVVGTDFVDILNSSVKGGYATVFYGGTAGVDTTRSAAFSQDTPGVPGSDESNDWFGTSLAAGDVNGDGYPDLAVGADNESIGSAEGVGNVWVLRGGPSGLTGTGAQSFNQDTSGVPGGNESADMFGGAVHLADHNKDGRADLSVGAGGENSDDGAVWVLRGSTGGVTATGAVSFGASSVGIGNSGNDPMFGDAMSGS